MVYIYALSATFLDKYSREKYLFLNLRVAGRTYLFTKTSSLLMRERADHENLGDLS